MVWLIWHFSIRGVELTLNGVNFAMMMLGILQGSSSWELERKPQLSPSTGPYDNRYDLTHLGGCHAGCGKAELQRHHGLAGGGLFYLLIITSLAIPITVVGEAFFNVKLKKS